MRNNGRHISPFAEFLAFLDDAAGTNNDAEVTSFAVLGIDSDLHVLSNLASSIYYDLYVYSVILTRCSRDSRVPLLNRIVLPLVDTL
jgi:hypothetical protein